MDIKFAAYSFRARALPVYLSLSPAALLLAALAPAGLQLPLEGAAALVFVPISFLLSQAGADFGKHLKKRIWCDCGGPPTTRFLRHGNREFNEVTRACVHDKLHSLGLLVLTREEQQQDARAAGFRRNLFDLNTFGVLIALASLAGTGWPTYTSWSAATAPPVSIVAGVINAGLLLAWMTWVTERTVKLAANRYARFIFEAALDQE